MSLSKLPFTEPALITNDDRSNLFIELKAAFAECEFFELNVAFISYSGLQIMLDLLKAADDRGVKGRIITSTYLNFTDPKALKKILSFSNIELRIFISKRTQGFHPKSYIFHNKQHHKIFVGSSNITNSALKSNIEWNVKTIDNANSPYVTAVTKEFTQLWDVSSPATTTLIDEYATYIQSLKATSKHGDFIPKHTVTPNSMQQEAINNLKRLQQAHHTKALVIAATGSGKTYMSAFAARDFGALKVLFIVHRESILLDAQATFSAVFDGQPNPPSLGLFTGKSKELDADYLFGTNLSVAKHLSKFKPETFDFIVIDEAHHVTSQSYQDIITYFRPKFLLGMTATPERGDAVNIYHTFDNNIAAEIRLREALDKDLVVPFHYYGVTDVQGLDYQEADLTDIAKLAKLLQTHRRVEYIVQQMQFYDFDGDKLKCLGFCVNIEHAQYMAEQFNLIGINAVALTGDDPEAIRQKMMQDIQDDTHHLQVIFTVDIFNEGVDIPSINLVLMLRPTQSPIIFLQQLGRGLRHFPDKAFLTVLDFIGNHERSFMIAIALYGKRIIDKDSLKVAVNNDFQSIPGCTHIQLDPIAKDYILSQLENENFNSAKYLNQEYTAFKLMCRNRVPMLMDYLLTDGAPDPVRFLQKYHTYIHFLQRVEKETPEIQALFAHQHYMQIYRFVCDHLPAKRITELYILRELIQQPSVSVFDIKQGLQRDGIKVTSAEIVFAFRYLAGEFFDSVDLNKYPTLGTHNNTLLAENELVMFDQIAEASPSFTQSEIRFNASSLWQTALIGAAEKTWLLDALDYGIARYHDEMSNKITPEHYLGLYAQYNMRDVAFASQYTKKHSAFRGQGLLKNGSDYFLFIELHKAEKAIQYKDKIISQTHLQWDSPSDKRPDSGDGEKLLKHHRYGIKLHVFVRKFKKIDGVTQPYIYIGPANVLSSEGQKPMTMQLQLHTPLVPYLYHELTGS